MMSRRSTPQLTPTSGLYHNNRLPYGIASAPALFQKTIDTILQGILQVVYYLDDILITSVNDTEHLQNLVDQNNQHSKIQFTMEEESGCELAFLDVLVTRKDERLLTSVYRKPTHTERYIPFNSHHHRKTITGVLRSMRDQAHRICDPSIKPQELHHLENVFEANGFPPNLVKKTLQVPPKSAPPPPTEDPQTEEPQKTLRTPYVRGLSEKLERISASLGIRSVFTPARVLNRTLMKVKSRLPDEKKKGVVYQIPCNNCDYVYTGESQRTLKVRVTASTWVQRWSIAYIRPAITVLTMY